MIIKLTRRLTHNAQTPFTRRRPTLLPPHAWPLALILTQPTPPPNQPHGSHNHTSPHIISWIRARSAESRDIDDPAHASLTTTPTRRRATTLSDNLSATQHHHTHNTELSRRTHESGYKLNHNYMYPAALSPRGRAQAPTSPQGTNQWLSHMREVLARTGAPKILNLSGEG